MFNLYLWGLRLVNDGMLDLNFGSLKLVKDCIYIMSLFTLFIVIILEVMVLYNNRELLEAILNSLLCLRYLYYLFFNEYFLLSFDFFNLVWFFLNRLNRLFLERLVLLVIENIFMTNFNLRLQLIGFFHYLLIIKVIINFSHSPPLNLIWSLNFTLSCSSFIIFRTVSS